MRKIKDICVLTKCDLTLLVTGCLLFGIFLGVTGTIMYQTIKQSINYNYNKK